MSSTLRIAASRANGAKSRGPVTPEGKARSSRNSVTHGLLQNGIVLPTENLSTFENMLAGYRKELEPESPIEERLIEIMAVADWRRVRLWHIETAHYTRTINEQIRRNDPIDSEDPSRIPAMHSALAFAALSEHSGLLQNLNRYEVRFSREFHRALRFLEERRAERKREAARRENSTFSKRTEPNAG